MRRSLLDTADIPALRARARAGAASAVAGALIDTGLLQFDPDDAEWSDRDRLVVAGPQAVAAVGERLAAAGADFASTAYVAGGEALAVALGAAVAARLDGEIWRAWCVLDESVCDDGRTWEAARAAVGADLRTLTVLGVGDESAALWRAAGWQVHLVPPADPVWLLGALDQALTGAPAAVLVSTDG